jgi:hypothetical protein
MAALAAVEVDLAALGLAMHLVTYLVIFLVAAVVDQVQLEALICATIYS